MPSPSPGPAPCSVAPQPVPCGTKTADPGKQSATQQFPFPGEASEGGASLTPYAEPAKLSGVPQAPGAAGAAASAAPGAAPIAVPSAGSGADSAAKTAAQFPFPGEDGKDGVSGTPDASSRRGWEQYEQLPLIEQQLQLR